MENTGKKDRRFDPAVIAQFVKYGLVGLLNTGITLAVIFILTKVFHVSDYIANAVGYVVGFVNSFLWNKLWTFRSKGNVLQESLLFILVFAVSYAVQFGFLVFLFEALKWKDQTFALPMGWFSGILGWKGNVLNLPMKDIAQVLSMGVYTVIGFLGNKLLTFKKGK